MFSIDEYINYIPAKHLVIEERSLMRNIITTGRVFDVSTESGNITTK